MKKTHWENLNVYDVCGVLVIGEQRKKILKRYWATGHLGSYTLSPDHHVAVVFGVRDIDFNGLVSHG